MIQGRTQSVGEAVTVERASLRPPATEPFDLQEVSFPHVDGAGCVRVKTNLSDCLHFVDRGQIAVIKRWTATTSVDTQIRPLMDT